MSTALAIAGVTAVLRDLLNDGLVNHNVSGIIGSTVIVSTLPPDKVVKNEGVEATQLNLFLRQVTPNSSWSNEGLPARDASGRARLSNPPLALNLHYLISAYGEADLQAEILLGYAMQLLHENPAIAREAIRTALIPSPDVGVTLPPALRALAESGLQDQIEQLRITPEYMSAEELSGFWTAAQAHFRQSAAYRVSVVLIQATAAARSPLPVLTRQATVRPDLLPPVPTINVIAPEGQQPVAVLGKRVDLKGHHLTGTGREVTLTHDRFNVDATLPAAVGGDDALLSFTVPVARADDFPVGAYRVGVRVQPPGEPEPRSSNRLAMTLAPQITNLPMTVTRDPGGTANFTIDFVPALREGQTVSLLLGEMEYFPDTFTAPATSLSFIIPDAPVADYLARLRIDGIDSPIVDRTASPPAFFNQRIKIQ